MTVPTSRRAPAPLLLALAVLLAAPAGLAAQSGQEVLETALDRHVERMEGVQNYTVVSRVMGFETTTYFERVERDGEVFFEPQVQMGSAAAERAPTNPYASFRELASRASLEGTEQVDGEACHVVVVTDLEGTDLYGAAAGGQGQGGFRPEKATFLVDTDDHLLREMRLDGTATMQGESRDAGFTARLMDYREVKGVVHPFRVQVTMEGMGPQMSEQQLQQLRQSMQQMQKQMENMSEEQRKMMEGMMGGQLEKMEQMLAAGAMDFTLEVEELRVNEGPPQDGS